MKKKYDVFISYSTKDQKIVEGLCAYLEQHGIRCFVAYRDIPPTTPWPPAIVEALENAKIMTIVFSENFNMSIEVDREIVIACKAQMPILTFRLEDANFEGTKKYYLENLNWIDAFPEPEKYFSRITTYICSLLHISSEKTSINKVQDNTLLAISKNGKYGYINANSETIIPFIFDWAGNFSEGLAVVEQNGKYGYIDTEGNIAIPLHFDFAYDFHGGTAFIEIKDRRVLINTIGEQISNHHFSNSEGRSDDYFSEDLAYVIDYETEKYGYINRKGELIIPFIYDNALDFKEGYASVEKGDKYGYIDKEGNIVIPFIYDYADSFSEGLAVVEINGKYGLIDKLGYEKISIIYEDAKEYSEGLAAVKKNGRYGYINKYGNEQIPFIYEDAKEFSEGLAAVKENGRYGFIDKFGNKHIPNIYDDAYKFYNGRACVEQQKGEGCINKSNQIVIPLCHRFIEFLNNGYIYVERFNDSCFYINENDLKINIE